MACAQFAVAENILTLLNRTTIWIRDHQIEVLHTLLSVFKLLTLAYDWRSLLEFCLCEYIRVKVKGE